MSNRADTLAHWLLEDRFMRCTQCGRLESPGGGAVVGIPGPEHLIEGICWVCSEGVERVCSVCQQEQGLPPEQLNATSNKSHGLCKRHFIKQAMDSGLSALDIDEMVRETMNGAGFAPDLGLSRNRHLIPAKASFYPSMGGPSSA